MEEKRERIGSCLCIAGYCKEAYEQKGPQHQRSAGVQALPLEESQHWGKGRDSDRVTWGLAIAFSLTSASGKLKGRFLSSLPPKLRMYPFFLKHIGGFLSLFSSFPERGSCKKYFLIVLKLCISNSLHRLCFCNLVPGGLI